MRVRVFHNVTEPGHWFGYRPGDELRLVLEFTAPEGVERDVLDFTFEELNIGAGDPIAQLYRARKLRSLSVGDVLSVRDGPWMSAEAFYACEPFGWKQVWPKGLPIGDTQ